VQRNDAGGRDVDGVARRGERGGAARAEQQRAARRDDGGARGRRERREASRRGEDERRGARERPAPSSKSMIPASCSFFSVRDRFDSLRWVCSARLRTELGRVSAIICNRTRFSFERSLTIASAELCLPSDLVAVSSLSNQLLGVSAAALGLVTTCLVHLMNSPIVPIL
jgi:hypothetical protein